LAARQTHHDELDELVSNWTSQHSPRDVMERLQAVHVPAAMVASALDLLDDPHLQAHDFLRVILQPGWDPLFVEGDCYRTEELAPPPANPAPRHGEHTREIAHELLGLDDIEIDRLVAAGVLEVPDVHPAEADVGSH
jgi:crotonobetainyl-CoA:carnitine CoA-transferase CaiB-like acyl-CoA transferase